MDLVNNLLLGFQTALTFQNLLYCFFGVTVGTLIGVLPGAFLLYGIFTVVERRRKRDA